VDKRDGEDGVRGGGDTQLVDNNIKVETSSTGYVIMDVR